MHGGEEWIRRSLILLTVFWLIAAVVLPMAALAQRAMQAEVSVAIWGDDEVRIGGREFLVEGDAVRVDGEQVELDAEGRAAGAGFEAWVVDGAFRELTCSRVELEGAWRDIAPISVRLGVDGWFIDGVALEEDDWQRTVTRGIGLAMFRKYASSPQLYGSLLNSLFVAFSTMVLSVSLALGYAYALSRSRIFGKPLFRLIAMLPLFAPTMLYGLSLVYLFGNQGVVTTGFFDAIPWLAFDIGLYGATGIVLAETVFTFPAAVMILSVALSAADARLYEAAESLGASPVRVFWTVTLPGIRYGLLSAALVCFTLAFTDFGAPKIVGGNYSVLAIDIYRQVVGQQNFGMGAVVSIVLLAPAAAAFALQRVVERRQTALLSARSVPYAPARRPWVDALLQVHCIAVAGFILLMVFTAGYASFVSFWPYDLSFSLKHYRFEGMGGGGYSAFWNSVRIACYTAIAGTALTFGSAWLVEKSKTLPLFRQSIYMLSMAPLALPGLVIGIAYILFFNRAIIPLPGIDLPNPFQALYGTVAILVVANIVHFYTVSYITATTALRQLDAEFEAVSESMAVPFYKTLFRVTIPLCLPAILEIMMYFFVNAMATVSAVVFLYTADTRVASVAVINMEDAGETAAAAAMCMLIVMTNGVARAGGEILGAWLRAYTQRWRLRGAKAQT